MPAFAGMTAAESHRFLSLLCHPGLDPKSRFSFLDAVWVAKGEKLDPGSRPG